MIWDFKGIDTIIINGRTLTYYMILSGAGAQGQCLMVGAYYEAGIFGVVASYIGLTSYEIVLLLPVQTVAIYGYLMPLSAVLFLYQHPTRSRNLSLF